MNWKNVHKTYEKAAPVRFPGQRGVDNYLSQTSKGPEVCPFLFKPVA